MKKNINHLFLVVYANNVSFTFNRGGGDVLRGSNPHDGSVQDADMQIRQFTAQFTPNSLEIVFDIASNPPRRIHNGALYILDQTEIVRARQQKGGLILTTVHKQNYRWIEKKRLSLATKGQVNRYLGKVK